jgi:hypothetical protein
VLLCHFFLRSVCGLVLNVVLCRSSREIARVLALPDYRRTVSHSLP